MFITLMSTGPLSPLIDEIMSLIAQYGYFAIFAAAFLETIFPPIPSEIIFPLIGFTAYNKGLGIENAIGMAAIGALGSTAGAIVIYFVSMKIGRVAILRYGRYVRISEHELTRTEEWFAKHGPIAVFGARMVPGMREIISIPAGLGGMGIGRFVLFSYAGSFIWSTALTLIGFYLGETWTKVSEELSMTFTIIGAIVVAVVIAVMVTWYAKHKIRPSKSP